MSKILIADDSMFMRMSLKTLIEGSGHTVVAEAINGKDAYEKYSEYKPDLVTMDITMPESDGLEGLSLIMKKFPDAKVIMITAMGSENMVVKAIELGAKNFIVKPYKKEKIVEILEAVLKIGGH